MTVHVDHIGLKYKSGHPLNLIDQTLLPHEVKWVTCSTLSEMEEAIKKLKVRGAPMIGHAANFFLASLAYNKKNLEEIKRAAEVLKNSRPTAVNLTHYMDEFNTLLNSTKETEWIEKWAYDHWRVDTLASEKMAALGATLLKPGFKVLTHCNTGGLAACGNGTALGTVVKAHSLYENLHVYVDETRPLLQGARLTTWELEQKKIPFTLICDSMSASLMQNKKIDAVVVGADRIAANGDTANKIGTYNLAVLCSHHEVPFYVVAPNKTVDPKLSDGRSIPIEERSGSEVRGFVHPHKEFFWSPECETYNPAFDITPSTLITAWVTQDGIFKKEDIKKGVFKKCGQ